MNRQMHALLSQGFHAHFSTCGEDGYLSGQASGPFFCPSGLPTEEPSSELCYLLHERFQLCMNQLNKFRKREKIMQCQEKVDPN